MSYLIYFHFCATFNDLNMLYNFLCVQCAYIHQFVLKQREVDVVIEIADILWGVSKVCESGVESAKFSVTYIVTSQPLIKVGLCKVRFAHRSSTNFRLHKFIYKLRYWSRSCQTHQHFTSLQLYWWTRQGTPHVNYRVNINCETVTTVLWANNTEWYCSKKYF